MKPVCKKCYEKFPLELKKRLKKLAETVGRKQTSESQGGDTQQHVQQLSQSPRNSGTFPDFPGCPAYSLLILGIFHFGGFQKPGILRKLLEVCSPTSNAEPCINLNKCPNQSKELYKRVRFTLKILSVPVFQYLTSSGTQYNVLIFSHFLIDSFCARGFCMWSCFSDVQSLNQTIQNLILPDNDL